MRRWRDGRRWGSRAGFAGVVLVVAVLASSCVFLARVTVDTSGNQLPGASVLHDVAGDGRWVLFVTSLALDPGDTNGIDDVYRKDTVSDAIVWVSITETGGAPNAAALDPRMSNDGNSVVWSTTATNVVAADNHIGEDVFLRDIAAGTTVQMTVDATGAQVLHDAQNPAIAGDGSVVAWDSFGDFVPGLLGGQNQVWHHVVATGAVELVSEATTGWRGNGFSSEPSISDNGTNIAYSSSASNLVAGDTNGLTDVFVTAGASFNFIVSTAGAVQGDGRSYAPSIAGNGLVVAFESIATNLIAGDVNGEPDVFVKNVGGQLFLASQATDGTRGSDASRSPSLNGDGTVVAFITEAPELGGNAGVVRDGAAGVTMLGAATSSGAPVFSRPIITHDGNYVAFTNVGAIINADTNGAFDGYLRWWADPSVASVAPASIPVGATTAVTITGDGFRRDASVEVSTNLAAPGADGVTFTNVVVVDDQTLTADATVLATAAPGLKWLNVEFVGTGPGADAGAFGNCQCLTVVP